MNGEVHVVDDVAAEFARIVASALEGKPEASLVLSGGSTATSCYQQLAKTSIDWAKISILWGDERRVPLDHDDSNYLLARRAMLDSIPSPKAVHPMEDAAAYESIVQNLVPFDVVHLGVGDDGHIASIFPGSDTLGITDRLVVEADDDLHKHPRITLTYPAIDSAQLVVYTVIGSKKAAIVKAIRAGEDLPVNRVKAKRQIWLLDDAANA